MEYSEQMKENPLKTGETVPIDRKVVRLDQLPLLLEKGEARMIPVSLDDVKKRFVAEASIGLPDELLDEFGFPQLSWAEVFHPNSQEIVFVGYEKKDNEDVANRSFKDAIGTLVLERSSGIGSPGMNNRLFPSGVKISGINVEDERVVSAHYQAEYVSFPGSTRKVNYYIDNVHIVVSDEDGFDFQEGQGDLQVYPYEKFALYLSYNQGIITQRMITKGSMPTGSQKQKLLDIQRLGILSGDTLKDQSFVVGQFSLKSRPYTFSTIVSNGFCVFNLNVLNLNNKFFTLPEELPARKV